MQWYRKVNPVSDDVNYLTNYITAFNVFACPSTRNYIDPDTFITSVGQYNIQGDHRGGRLSLTVNAADRNGGRDTVTNFHSYAVFGMYFHGGVIGNIDQLKTINNVGSYVTKHSSNHPSWPVTAGSRPGPTGTMIFSDQDNASATDSTRVYGNYPEAGDNHGVVGNNVAYCDGHAALVQQKKYPPMFMLSQDENSAGYLVPNPAP